MMVNSEGPGQEGLDRRWNVQQAGFDQNHYPWKELPLAFMKREKTSRATALAAYEILCQYAK